MERVSLMKLIVSNIVLYVILYFDIIFIAHMGAYF